jgi:hypothetical protein
VEVIATGDTDEQGNVEVTSSNVRMRHNVADPYRVVGLLEQAAFGVFSPYASHILRDDHGMNLLKVIEFIVFLAVAYPLLRTVGRWMQRKGRDLEKGP